jgi:nucleotide-binding universal stress UspA family protein
MTMDGDVRSRPVVVGVDGSASALDAVRWAAGVAAWRNAPLRLVMAFSWQRDRVAGGITLDAEPHEVMLGVARSRLAEAAAGAVAMLPEEQVETELVAGYPISVLRAESQRAQLLVLGDRGYGAISGLLLGSVAAAMVAHAACPVVLVRNEEGGPVEDRTRPIVVGVDGSPVSEAALAFAYEQASARGVPLIAVHTWWDMIVDARAAMLINWDAMAGDEKAVLAERLAGWGEKYPDVRVHRKVTRDRPAHALVEESHRAQLLVVGSRGRGGAAALVLGSVSHAVLHRAHCSVAVVRPLAQETA